MRWEKFLKNCAFATILFLLVNALEALRWSGTSAVRDYIAFAFTTDWDYRGTLEQARASVRTLATYTEHLRRTERSADGFGEPGSPTLPTPAPAPPSSERPAEASPAPAPEPAAEPIPEPNRSDVNGEQRGGRSVPQLVWPVRGRVTEPYGRRSHPIRRLMGVHEGIDLAVPAGTPVGAAASGRVKAAFRSLSAGLAVDLDHGGFVTRYFHLSAIKVQVGQRVQAGEVIGLAGSTGLSTGPHLHFEVHLDGHPVDPLPLLPR